MTFNPFNAPPATPKTFVSAGFGVQSSTVLLMAAHGEIKPMPDAAIFADTQAEPKNVYEWKDRMTEWLPFPVVTVTKGDLVETSLTIRDRKSGEGQWAKSLIPVYTLESDGTAGHMQRACTYDYKLMPLLKAQRQLGEVKRGQKHITVTSWIGISLDEIQRVKPSREPWVQNRYPLIEMGMTRLHCIEWMRDHGYPEPPRSACYMCPFHSDKEWRRLQTEEPEEFAKAVKFERDYQAVKAETDNMRGVPYLHNSRRPLDEVDFSFGENQMDLFNNECLGMCGV